jgi:hypothetical protein
MPNLRESVSDIVTEGLNAFILLYALEGETVGAARATPKLSMLYHLSANFVHAFGAHFGVVSYLKVIKNKSFIFD